jgi:histone acetyltransferase (RNA polymerase elongator complex component)
MARTWTLRFPPPDPPADTVRLVPFFLPFAGCPGRCVFCDQQAQTGREAADPGSALRELENRLAGARPPFGLGLFGGTFTGLPVAWQDRFLAAAARYRGSGGLVHVRVSTRPDRIDMGTLARLRGQGVDMVELGVQTFDSAVLVRSGRGYEGEVAARACEMVRAAGMALGIQLLPGLPGHDAAMWREDVARALALKPEAVRVYPCVVMAGTGLADMFARGEFVPWDLEDAVRACGRALLEFWEAGVRVIRLGLAGEPAMLARLVAGPWHPAFGNMARSLALRLFLEHRLRLAGGRLVRMTVPARLCGELWGHGRANAPALAELGIDKDRVTFRPQPEFAVELEE